MKMVLYQVSLPNKHMPWQAAYGSTCRGSQEFILTRSPIEDFVFVGDDVGSGSLIAFKSSIFFTFFSTPQKASIYHSCFKYVAHASMVLSAVWFSQICKSISTKPHYTKKVGTDGDMYYTRSKVPQPFLSLISSLGIAIYIFLTICSLILLVVN